MSQDSSIEWTDATWNPTTGCSKISPGCANCYIERTPPFRMAGRKFVNGKIPLQMHEDRLDYPLRWKKPRLVFVNSLSDLFHKEVPDAIIDQTFAVMALCPQHTFQVLTKRPERMATYLLDKHCAWRHWKAGEAIRPGENGSPGLESPCYPNVLLGVSVENRKHGLPRIEHLCRTPAAVRWLSIEPLLEDLGRVDLLRNEFGNPAHCVCGHGHGFTRCPNTGGISRSCHVKGCPCPGFARVPGSWNGIDWVVVGGESGPGARPMHPGWVRSIRDQCVAAGVAFFFKQWGEWVPTTTQCDERCQSHAIGRPHVFNGQGTTSHRSFSDGLIASLSATKSARGGCRLQDGEILYLRVGKKSAGRLLDGREWDEMPAQKAKVSA